MKPFAAQRDTHATLRRRGRSPQNSLSSRLTHPRGTAAAIPVGRPVAITIGRPIPVRRDRRQRRQPPSSAQPEPPVCLQSPALSPRIGLLATLCEPPFTAWAKISSVIPAATPSSTASTRLPHRGDGSFRTLLVFPTVGTTPAGNEARAMTVPPLGRNAVRLGEQFRGGRCASRRLAEKSGRAPPRSRNTVPCFPKKQF